MLVDNWPLEPVDPAESEHSGGSIELLEAEPLGPTLVRAVSNPYLPAINHVP
jgi:hypothetical protein